MEKSTDELLSQIAAALGRRGGFARAAKLTEAQRSAIASKAVRARWRKYRAAHPTARRKKHKSRTAA